MFHHIYALYSGCCTLKYIPARNMCTGTAKDMYKSIYSRITKNFKQSKYLSVVE